MEWCHCWTEEIAALTNLNMETYLRSNKKKWIRWCIYHVVRSFLQQNCNNALYIIARSAIAPQKMCLGKKRDSSWLHNKNKKLKATSSVQIKFSWKNAQEMCLNKKHDSSWLYTINIKGQSKFSTKFYSVGINYTDS